MTTAAKASASSLFAPEVYRARRHALARAVASGLILLPGASDAPMRYRANAFPFVQDGSFAYFFGIDEPDHAGVIDCDTGRATLFGPEPDLDDLVWHGPQPSLADRAAWIGADNSGSLAELEQVLATALSNRRPLHHLPPIRGETSLFLSALLVRHPATLGNTASPALIDAVVTLREVKDAGEVEEMERALATTARMHNVAAKSARPGAFEHEVVSAMAAEVNRDRRRFAYTPIFSRRGDVLHNMKHDGQLRAGDLVINDAGATSPMGYASDITRTLPVGGRFSTQQRDIYNIVFSAQRQAIGAMRPGVPYRDVHLLAARIIADGFVGIGLLRDDADTLVSEGVHALFFPHGLGHQIGLDTHDMEALGEDRVGYGKGVERSRQFGLSNLRLAKPLVPGMVVTVEPGIYFIQPLIERWRAERRFEGLINWEAVAAFESFGGIRIEDDVLVFASGARTLGPVIPMRADEVEAMMG